MTKRPSASRTRAAALVMAKAPRRGYVKTRLEPVLGQDGCARLQRLLTRHALSWACSVAPRAAFAAVAPRDAAHEIANLSPRAVRVFPQIAGSLGERLAAATERVFAEHPGPLVIVGTDCPALREQHAEQALEALDDGADACFGPAIDGGYYLLALKRPLAATFALPADAWGGPTVLELSVRCARRAGAEVALIPPERDLDDVRDARAAIAHPQTPPDVAELLAMAVATTAL